MPASLLNECQTTLRLANPLSIATTGRFLREEVRSQSGEASARSVASLILVVLIDVDTLCFSGQVAVLRMVIRAKAIALVL